MTHGTEGPLAQKQKVIAALREHGSDIPGFAYDQLAQVCIALVGNGQIRYYLDNLMVQDVRFLQRQPLV